MWETTWNVIKTPTLALQPMVVLPGWIVKYLKGASPEIRDPRNASAWIKKLPPVLPEAKVNAIADVLEKRCRNLCFDEADRIAE